MRFVSSLSNPTLTLAYATHAGRTGKNNEDDYVFFEAQADRGSPVAVLQVAAVADGIGGNMGGEMASHLAAQTFHDTFRSHSDTPLRRRLLEAIEGANREIYDRSLVDLQLQGMGTTIVAAALAGDQLHLVHAGDSRAYLIRNGHAHQLTLDHTWAQEAIDAGRLTPEQAREHPNRHVIKRFLGIAPSVELDSTLLNLNNNRIDGPLQVMQGDTILLCSDGLTDVVSDAQIEQTVSRYPVQDAANRLIDMANKAGGPDNITVLMLQWRDSNTPTSAVGGKRWLIGLGLVLVLGLLAGGAWFLLNRNQSGEETSATPTSAPTIAAALDTATPLPAVDTPTSPPASDTETALPSATPLATETAILSATSTPLPEQANVDASTATTTAVATANSQTTNPISNTLTEDTRPTATQPPAKVPTSTPLPDLPTNTATPSVTPTATSTPTPLATANFVPTATQRAAAAAKPTATVAQAVPAAQPPPTLNSVVASPSLKVELLAPGDGDAVNGRRTFSWQVTSGALQSGFALEPVFSKQREDLFVNGQGWGGSTIGNEVGVDLPGVLPDGIYRWGVLLISTSPYKRYELISDQRTVRVERPSGAPSSGLPAEPPIPKPVEDPP